MLKVKIEKLNMIPNVIPSDFLCPPVTDEDKIIGNNGQIHGARIVTKPDRNAKKRRITIRINHTTENAL